MVLGSTTSSTGSTAGAADSGAVALVRVTADSLVGGAGSP